MSLPHSTRHPPDDSPKFTDACLLSISATLKSFFVLLFQMKELGSPKYIAMRLPQRLSYLKDTILHDRLYNISGLNFCDSDTAVYEPLPMFAIENSDSFYAVNVPFLDVTSYNDYLKAIDDLSLYKSHTALSTGPLMHYRGRISEILSDKHGIYEMDAEIVLVSPLQSLTKGTTITCYNCNFVSDVKAVFLVANTHSYFKKNSRNSKFIEPRVAGIEDFSSELQRAVILNHLHKIKPLHNHLDLICNVFLLKNIHAEISQGYFANFIKPRSDLKLDVGSVQTVLTVAELKSGAKWSTECVVIVISIIIDGRVHFLDESGRIEAICLNAVHIKHNCVYKILEFLLHSDKYVVVDEEHVELVWDYKYAEFREQNSTHQYTILISEKNHTIRNNKFICRTDPDYGDLCNVTLCISSRWFSYICPGHSYILSTNIHLTEKLLVFDETEDLIFNFQSCYRKELGLTTDHDLEMRGSEGFKDLKDSDMYKMVDNTLVNLCGEIVGINPKYISVKNNSSEITNIGLSLAVSRVLPNGLSSGVTVAFHNLLVKVSAQGKSYIHVTTLTTILVTSVTPRAHISAVIIPILQLTYPSQSLEGVPQKSNKIVSIRGTCETILSFVSAPGKMSCKFSLADLTGSSNVFIDQATLIRSFFSLTETDVAVIRSSGIIAYGRHHLGSVVSSEVEEILTRPLRHHQMFLVQGKAHRGKSANLVKTEFGQTMKHHNVTLYPLSIERLCVKELVMELSNSEN